jgi:hypothetical protein
MIQVRATLGDPRYNLGNGELNQPGIRETGNAVPPGFRKIRRKRWDFAARLGEFFGYILRAGFINGSVRAEATHDPPIGGQNPTARVVYRCD